MLLSNEPKIFKTDTHSGSRNNFMYKNNLPITKVFYLCYVAKLLKTVSLKITLSKSNQYRLNQYKINKIKYIQIAPKYSRSAFT